MTDQNILQPPPAVLKATITIVRAKTGKVETYELVGTPMPPEPEQPETKGEEHVSHS